MRYVNGRVEIYSRVRTHTPTHTTHTCGRAGPAAWLKRGFHFLVKICQKKTITPHSWRHLRPQFFFCHKKVAYVTSKWKTLVHLSAEHQQRQKLLNRVKTENTAASDVMVLAGHRGRFSLLFIVRGVRRREGAAGHVPSLPPVVSRITILHAQGSE